MLLTADIPVPLTADNPVLIEAETPEALLEVVLEDSAKARAAPEEALLETGHRRGRSTLGTTSLESIIRRFSTIK